jgi:aminoglycoside phosphotransferase (APT) family kinase protein
MTVPALAERAAARQPMTAEASLDLAAMQPRLRRALAQLRPALVAATLASARPLAAKPAGRMLIEYRLEVHPAGRTLVLFGKQFSDLSQAARLHRAWAGLEASDLGPDAGVPRLVGLVEDLGLVLYLPAAGRPLAEDLTSDRAGDGVRRTAEWLGRLHAAAIVLDRRFDLAHEVDNALLWAERVGAEHPEVAGRARRLGGEMAARARTVQADIDVPIHKDIHPAHVLVGARLVVIDFDEMRLGDRSFDLAHFCVYLHLAGIRSGRATHFGRLERAFLGRYAARTGWVADARFGFFWAYSCLKVAKQLAFSTGVRPRPAGAERIRQLRAILEAGRAPDHMPM